MSTPFIVKALPANHIEKFHTFSDQELAHYQAQWIRADADPGYPCRVSLQDAKVGERVLALPYTHHDVNSPYRASGPIFVREQAEEARLSINEIPSILLHRKLSIRAYDANHMMIDARTCQGADLESVIAQLFLNAAAKYLHVHNAGPGCFNCSVNRA